jgi:hypothetical protein
MRWRSVGLDGVKVAFTHAQQREVGLDDFAV